MKKSKKLKGMTLIECIVSLAVLTVFTTGMVTAAAGLSKLKVNTNEVIKKNSYQAQMIDNQLDGTHADMFTKNDSIITITFNSTDKYFVAKKNTAKSQVETKDADGKVISVTYDAIEGRNFQYYNNIAVKP